MSTLTALEKRIKRHVIAGRRSFFAAASPGLEGLCLKELRNALPEIDDSGTIPGGVEFSGDLHDGYLANLMLRTAGRILMRLDGFTCESFRVLEKKIANFPWELHLAPGPPPLVEVTCRKSRLYHTGAIAERFQSGITARLAGVSADPQGPPGEAAHRKIAVRAVENRFTVSLDSSGERLYRRGIKQHVMPAPLRETTAAAILMLAGYDGSEPLLDPMCGSGTFPIEAAMMAQRIPPGWYREFGFFHWPAFRLTRRRWEYAREAQRRRFQPIEEPRIFASDLDESACRALTQNISRLKRFAAVSVNRADLFDLMPSRFGADAGLVVANPPYGHRMGTDRESARLFLQLCQKLKKDFKGWRFAIIVPRPELVKKMPAPERAVTIMNGGLRLKVVFGRW